VQCEPLSPNKYLAAKKSVYGQLQFKKKPCPQPDDDISATILTSNVPDAGSPNPAAHHRAILTTLLLNLFPHKKSLQILLGKLLG